MPRLPAATARPVRPQLVGPDGIGALRAAIAAPERYAIEPKLDGVRALVVFDGERIIVESRHGRQRGDWLDVRPFRRGLEAFATALPIIRRGTVLDGELVAGSSVHTTLSALARPLSADVRLHVFDLPIFAGVDVRREPWTARRARLETLATAFRPPLVLVPLLDPCVELAEQIESDAIEGVVIKDRGAHYRGGSRSGWTKLKAPGRDERHGRTRRR